MAQKEYMYTDTVSTSLLSYIVSLHSGRFITEYYVHLVVIERMLLPWLPSQDGLVESSQQALRGLQLTALRSSRVTANNVGCPKQQQGCVISGTVICTISVGYGIANARSAFTKLQGRCTVRSAVASVLWVHPHVISAKSVRGAR